MVNWLALCLMILASVGPCVLRAHGQSAEAFHWLDQKRDAGLWNSVSVSFHSQLTDRHSDYGEMYGYLKLVGVFGNCALVVVTYRMSKDPQGGDQYSSAFNYDIATKSISKVARLDYMWYWSFFKLARFEASPAPDVLFTYDDCTGCEADEMLSTAHYDPALRQWRARQWKTEGKADWTTETGLIVEDAPDPDDPLISDDNLYGVVYLDGGFDGVALRSRWISKRTPHHVDDWTLMYGAKSGILVGKLVSDKQEQLRIWSKLCVKRGNKLCRDVSAKR